MPVVSPRKDDETSQLVASAEGHMPPTATESQSRPVRLLLTGFGVSRLTDGHTPAQRAPLMSFYSGKTAFHGNHGQPIDAHRKETGGRADLQRTLRIGVGRPRG